MMLEMDIRIPQMGVAWNALPEWKQNGSPTLRLRYEMRTFFMPVQINSCGFNNLPRNPQIISLGNKPKEEVKGTKLDLAQPSANVTFLLPCYKFNFSWFNGKPIIVGNELKS